MKTLTLSLIALTLGVASVKAQIFQPNIVNGAIVGGMAGAIIGHNSGHHTGEGAVIGTAAGAVIGSLAQPQFAVVYPQPAPVVYEYESPAPVVVEQRCEPAPVYYGYYGYGYRPYCYGPRWGVTFGYGYRGGWGWHDRDGGWHRRDRR
ncbi:MAG TPA: YMGG-like glycine zipper-containing protein [Opitutaceae bacterium]|jgi:hypothetical protein|nr:YMGG-like glycine zipper-containing protein [Opitutaceae bacterium]